VIREFDPRLKDELEKMNSCTNEINRLEIQQEDASKSFRLLLSNSTQRLRSLSKNLDNISESIHSRRKMVQSNLENLDYDTTIADDLSNIHLRDSVSFAATTNDLSVSYMGGRDSALGSTSVVDDSVFELGEYEVNSKRLSVRRDTNINFIEVFRDNDRIEAVGSNILIPNLPNFKLSPPTQMMHQSTLEAELYQEVKSEDPLNVKPTDNDDCEASSSNAKHPNCIEVHRTDKERSKVLIPNSKLACQREGRVPNIMNPSKLAVNEKNDHKRHSGVQLKKLHLVSNLEPVSIGKVNINENVKAMESKELLTSNVNRTAHKIRKVSDTSKSLGLGHLIKTDRNKSCSSIVSSRQVEVDATKRGPGTIVSKPVVGTAKAKTSFQERKPVAKSRHQAENIDSKCAPGTIALKSVLKVGTSKRTAFHVAKSISKSRHQAKVVESKCASGTIASKPVFKVGTAKPSFQVSKPVSKSRHQAEVVESKSAQGTIVSKPVFKVSTAKPPFQVTKPVSKSRHQLGVPKSKRSPGTSAAKPIFKVGIAKPSVQISKSKKRKSPATTHAESNILKSRAVGSNPKSHCSTTKLNGDTVYPPWRIDNTPRQRSDGNFIKGTLQACASTPPNSKVHRSIIGSARAPKTPEMPKICKPAFSSVTPVLRPRFLNSGMERKPPTSGSWQTCASPAPNSRVSRSTFGSANAAKTPEMSKIYKPTPSSLHGSVSQLSQTCGTSSGILISRPRFVTSVGKCNIPSYELSRTTLPRNKSQKMLSDIKTDVRKPLFGSRGKSGNCEEMSNHKGRVLTPRLSNGA